MQPDLVDQFDLHRRGFGNLGDMGKTERQSGDQRGMERQRGAGPGDLGAIGAHGWTPPTETKATRFNPARFISPITRITRP